MGRGVANSIVQGDSLRLSSWTSVTAAGRGFPRGSAERPRRGGLSVDDLTANHVTARDEAQRFQCTSVICIPG